MKPRELKQSLAKLSPSRKDVAGQQRAVLDHVLLNSPNLRARNFSNIAAIDVGHVFHSTDEVFFGGLLSRFLEKNYSSPLTFRLSRRMTVSGGMTTMSHQIGSRISETRFEIAVATTPLFETFAHDSESTVGGLVCGSRLEALQRIVEHEMVHLVELMLTGDSNCQDTPFRGFVKRHFGHLESNHELLTPRDVARMSMGIRCGDLVTFNRNGERYRGLVNRITKRATILVKDCGGVPYSDGVRYRKFYVPLSSLKKVKAA